MRTNHTVKKDAVLKVNYFTPSISLPNSNSKAQLTRPLMGAVCPQTPESIWARMMHYTSWMVRDEELMAAKGGAAALLSYTFLCTLQLRLVRLLMF